MRVVISGGGTAGHINPALAIGKCIKQYEEDSEILYIGAKGRMEEELVPKAGFNFESIEISGFQRSFSRKAMKNNLITLKRIVTAYMESKKILKSFNPDICIGTGGYVSGPVLKCASKMGIKIVLHEQNAYPGITTKILSKKASCIMLATKKAKKYFKGNFKIEVTGNPIRKEITTIKKENARKKLNFDSRPVILSFGGSLGANKINFVIAEFIENIVEKGCKYFLIHSYGNDNNFLNILKSKGIRLKDHKNFIVKSYLENMPLYLSAADLVISRAGAITLSEIQAASKASILIPSPNVAENHQYRNAIELVKKNAAKLIEEKNLTKELLIKTVDDIISNKETLNILSKNAGKMAILNADKKIYNIIKNIVRK
ncbi:MAG: undecaprenyldiphospho-muramoylpentapeptide beta-N-acetylglucosaminyltransferase [Oscillospiraceae bacterium]|jgi:UDP-N-acetylglucosamine--N-acetylmuramyl-(pentapeptide) pyrophosphoryl-undecaprenol N-acetylglucosamine transferase|nr:undecaprenyldiphospho-muramoylpentapeptide beta-N-acetylglucosaminyltransferase [Oscillospiraceae bacterium]